MAGTARILAICGSTRKNSSNLKLLRKIAAVSEESFSFSFFEDIDKLPHFNPDLDSKNPPKIIIDFRNKIEYADAILFCTPEYVFSIPGSLKNALEWCVSTVIFSNKPVGIITASASGEMGKAEIELIMKTLGANFSEKTSILIKGIQGKLDEQGNFADSLTEKIIKQFIEDFEKQIFI